MSSNKTLTTALERGSPASLVAHTPLLVLDVSTRGCLFESRRPLEPGFVGTLRLALSGGWYVEDVRITRCVAVPGRGATYQIGVEFLRTHGVPEHSFRSVIGAMIAATLPDGEPTPQRTGSASDRRT
jgi:hypothetical protein